MTSPLLEVAELLHLASFDRALAFVPCDRDVVSLAVVDMVAKNESLDSKEAVHSLSVVVGAMNVHDVVVAVASMSNVASWLDHGSAEMPIVVGVYVEVAAILGAVVAVAAVTCIDASYDLAADHSHYHWPAAADYTYPDSFREKVPYSKAMMVDSCAFHSIASFAMVAAGAWDSFDASGNLAACVMDAAVALHIVDDSSFGSCYRNFAPDFPFDELEALAVDRTLVAAAVVRFSIGAYVPIAFVVVDIVESDQRSSLESVLVLKAIKNYDHHAPLSVDVHAKNSDPDIFRCKFCMYVLNDQSK